MTKQQLGLSINKIKALEEKLNIKNSDYFHRWVFLGAFIIILAAALIICHLEGWDFSWNEYRVCNDVKPCIDEDGFIMQPGQVIGELPSSNITSYPYFVGFVIFMSFLINHFVYVIKKITRWRYQNAKKK